MFAKKWINTVIATTIFLTIKFEDMKKDDPIVVVPVSMKLSEKKQIKEKAIKQRRTVSGFMTVKALDIINF